MPNDIPIDLLSYSFRDYSDEVSTVSFTVGQATDKAAYDTLKLAMNAALTGLTNGQRSLITESLQSARSNLAASDSASHREKKILVRYQDNTNGRLFTVSIPTRDDDEVVYLTNTDFLDLSVSPQADFISAFQAIAISPYGNAVTVISMESVGRNL